MKSELVVRDAQIPASRLDELAIRIRVEHAAVIESLERSLRHALRVGKALLEARPQFGARGGFAKWVEEECGLSYLSVATFYMRIAHYEEFLPAGLNYSEAIAYLRGYPPIDGRSSPYPETLKAEVRRRKANGESRDAIAESLGLPKGTINNWYYNRKRRRDRLTGVELSRRKRQLERLERREAKRAEAAQAARLKGGSIAKSYGFLRQLAQELDRAISQAEDNEVRRQLKAALRETHTAEAFISTALGVDYGSWRD